MDLPVGCSKCPNRDGARCYHPVRKTVQMVHKVTECEYWGDGMDVRKTEIKTKAMSCIRCCFVGHYQDPSSASCPRCGNTAMNEIDKDKIDLAIALDLEKYPGLLKNLFVYEVDESGKEYNPGSKLCKLFDLIVNRFGKNGEKFIEDIVWRGVLR